MNSLLGISESPGLTLQQHGLLLIVVAGRADFGCCLRNSATKHPGLEIHFNV